MSIIIKLWSGLKYHCSENMRDNSEILIHYEVIDDFFRDISYIFWGAILITNYQAHEDTQCIVLCLSVWLVGYIHLV